MKVKRHGKFHWEIDVTCENCDAIITLERADDMFAKYPVIGTRGDSVVLGPITYCCTCPECRMTVKVDSSIREDIKSKIQILM